MWCGVVWCGVVCWQVDNGAYTSGYVTLLPPIRLEDAVGVVQVANGSAVAVSLIQIANNGTVTAGNPIGVGGYMYVSNYASVVPVSRFPAVASNYSRGINISTPSLVLEVVRSRAVWSTGCGCVCCCVCTVVCAIVCAVVCACVACGRRVPRCECPPGSTPGCAVLPSVR